MQLTESAKKRLAWIEQNYAKAARLTVESGGCAGFKYLFDVGEPQDDDEVLDNLLYVDPSSAEILNGAVVDFVEGIDGNYFRVEVPSAKSGCGCGDSFAL